MSGWELPIFDVDGRRVPVGEITGHHLRRLLGWELWAVPQAKAPAPELAGLAVEELYGGGREAVLLSIERVVGGTPCWVVALPVVTGAMEEPTEPRTRGRAGDSS
ncbi:MAG TPA: hypothetical protein VM305_01200 [Candidatus Limnocylindrales bacterium]|nr:hypothetical protein [Candidatus Limnocylindrales bacterium]